MEKTSLLNEVDKASFFIENIMNSENKGGLKEFIVDLDKLKLKVINNSLINNPLRGFPRRYAEMYNGYFHPVTDVLNNIEKSVDDYLETN